MLHRRISPLLAQSPIQSNEICNATSGQRRTSDHLAGLTEDAIHKHLKLMSATAMGRVNKRRQPIRSTSKTPIVDAPKTDTDFGTKTYLVYAVLVDQGQIYTDLTGKFPVRSSKGNSYVMVCYVYDCNYVKIHPHEISVRLRMGQGL
jgi:hypothetical protein